MGVPSLSNLTLYTDTPLDDIDWLDNWTQTVNWFTDGTADLTVNSVAGAFKIKSLTTAQRDALTPSTGLLIFNTDNFRPEFYDGQRWQTL